MPFTSPVVAGVQLVRNAIQSQNFVTGISGWRISRNGDAEFNSGTFRGSLVIGTPLAGPGAEIGASLPAEIVTFYSGLTAITEFSILMSVGGGAYHYEIVGLDVTTRPYWAIGWVDSSLTVHELYGQELQPTADVHIFSARLLAAQRAVFQFGTNLGAAQTFRNTFTVYNSSVVFGAASGDQGAVQMNTPATAAAGLAVSGSPLAVAATSDITYAGISIGRGPVYQEQLTGTFTTGIGLAEQQFFTTAVQIPFPNDRAYRLRLSGQWECAAANNPTLAIREISSAGRALLKWGHIPISNLSTDEQFDVEGVFVNTSGIALTRLIVVTITLSVATLIRFDGAAAPQVSEIVITDVGEAIEYPNAISLA